MAIWGVDAGGLTACVGRLV